MRDLLLTCLVPTALPLAVSVIYPRQATRIGVPHAAMGGQRRVIAALDRGAGCRSCPPQAVALAVPMSARQALRYVEEQSLRFRNMRRRQLRRLRLRFQLARRIPIRAPVPPAAQARAVVEVGSVGPSACHRLQVVPPNRVGRLHVGRQPPNRLRNVDRPSARA